MINTAQDIIDKNLTMVPLSGVLFAMDRAVEASRYSMSSRFGPHAPPKDVIVECGVWRGGCSLAMLMAQWEALGTVKCPVWMLDSFEGLPPVTERDGPAAKRWQRTTDHNCKADQAALEEMFLRYPPLKNKHWRVFPGLFEETLSGIVAESPRIVLLRIDCDWYDSVRPCLEQLMPLVADGGTIILDDYYAWDGCARAVHDYFSQNNLAYRLRSLPDYSAAYFTKG